MGITIITGAAGFLGSHIARRLVEAGTEVVGIDNGSTGRESNIKPFAGHANFRFVLGDVTVPSTLEALADLEPGRVTEIYHLASPASPVYYQAHPIATIEANTTGLRHMLELARRHGARLLYASTSEAYGDPEVHPQPEEYRGNVNTWGPRACYDEAKRLGEVYCYEYYRLYGTRVRVARIFNTYSAGLRNDDGRVISNFVTQALAGRDITVYGDGSQSRSFCYVDDTVAGLQLLMEKEVAEGQIVNIGNPAEYSILEVARLVKRLTGSASAIKFLPLPADDPKVRRPVIDKAVRLLGWTPKIGLEEGLKLTVDAFRQAMREGEKL